MNEPRKHMVVTVSGHPLQRGVGEPVVTASKRPAAVAASGKGRGPKTAQAMKFREFGDLANPGVDLVDAAAEAAAKRHHSRLKAADTRRRNTLERVRALKPVVAQMRADGIDGPAALAAEFNVRGIPSERGGTWSGADVRRLLDWIAEADGVKTVSVPWNRRGWVEGLKPILTELRATGLATPEEIAAVLNARLIPNGSGRAWWPEDVARVLVWADAL